MHCALLAHKVNSRGNVGAFFECCNREVGFLNTVREAHKMYQRVVDEYGARARKAADNDGLDWKALSHAVRVATEALELFATGEITFPLSNAEHLRHIKLGLVPYPEVGNEIETLLDRVEQAAVTCSLRETPNQDFIDRTVREAYRQRITLT